MPLHYTTEEMGNEK